MSFINSECSGSPEERHLTSLEGDPGGPAGVSNTGAECEESG